MEEDKRQCVTYNKLVRRKICTQAKTKSFLSGVISKIQGVPSARGLGMGWVESCLGCSAIMPSCSAIYAQFPSAKADDRTTNIKVNPTKLRVQMELPVYIKEISRSEQRGWATKSNTGSINNELKPPISSLIIIR